MDESTKKVLIITGGVVIIIVAVLVFIPPSFINPSEKIIKCQDGSSAILIMVDPYVLKYAGKKVEVSIETAEKLKTSIGIGDHLIQQAIASTQFLDQQLRLFIAAYNARACTHSAEKMYEKLVDIRVRDLQALASLNQQLTQVSKSGSPSNRTQGEEYLKKVATDANNTGDTLLKARKAE